MAKGTKKADPIEIPLDQIVGDKATQCRVQTDDNVVADYAELMRADPPVAFPAIELVADSAKAETYYVVDGWTRIAAHRKAGFSTIYAVVVKTGTLNDAIDLATGANRTHGLQRSNADKRRAVTMAIKLDQSLGRERSDRDIAIHTGVHHSTVQDVRAEVTGVGTTRKAKGGKKPKADDGGNDDGDGSGSGTEKATSPTTDPAGQKLSDPRVMEAVGALPTFAAIIADIAAVASKVKALATTSPGQKLDVTAIERELSAAAAGVKFARPHAQCPYGANKLCDETCKACKGAGWVTEQVWDRIPKAIRESASIEAEQPAPEGEPVPV